MLSTMIGGNDSLLPDTEKVARPLPHTREATKQLETRVLAALFRVDESRRPRFACDLGR
jgi:hypothetical protein